MKHKTFLLIISSFISYLSYSQCTQPDAPIIYDNVSCCNNSDDTTTVVNIASGATVNWYSDNTKSTIIHTGDFIVFDNSSEGVQYFYVSQTVLTCESELTEHMITIAPEAKVKISTSSCDDNSYDMLCNYTNGSVYNWSNTNTDNYISVDLNEDNKCHLEINSLLYDTIIVREINWPGCTDYDTLVVMNNCNITKISENTPQSPITIKGSIIEINSIDNSKIDIQIFNNKGQLVINTSEAIINIADLKKGIYFIYLNLNDTVFSKKINFH